MRTLAPLKSQLVHGHARVYTLGCQHMGSGELYAAWLLGLRSGPHAL